MKETAITEAGSKPMEIGPYSYWIFAMCALSGLKKIRGGLLIPRIEKISGLLVDLQDKGLVIFKGLAMRRVSEGVLSEDVADWIGLTKAGISGANIEKDLFEQDKFLITPRVEIVFLRATASELCFADQAERDQVFRIAQALSSEFHDRLLNISQNIRRIIEKASTSTNDKKLKAFLIPLACCMFLDEDFSLLIVASEIPRHLKGCYYCREALKVHCGSGWEEYT